MATVNQNDLRIKNSKNLIASFNTDSGDALSYIFMGRIQPWTDDNLPPTPPNNYQSFYSTYDNLFALKRIFDTDCYHMIPRVNWVPGTVYDYYRQDYTPENRAFSGASNLYDCVWIVRNTLNNVYVCLNNNGDTPSTTEPLNTSDEPFVTSDGYQWQRVYNLTSGTYAANTTDDFMPIIQNDVVVSVDGAISTVVIENPGADFTTSPVGASNQVPYYFCDIDGDGSGAVARVGITASKVTSIEVVRAGSGYTYGSLNFIPNQVYESLADLDAQTDALNMGGDGTFKSTVIVPPPGGWGTDLIRELGGTRVGVFSTLNFDLFNFFDVPFRQIGILQDMTLAATNPNTVSACYAVQVTGIPVNKTYNSGEIITQIVKDADDQDRLAKGVVIAYDRVSGVIRYSQNSTCVDTDGNLYRFGGTAQITGLSSQLGGTPTDYTGSLTDIPFVDGYSDPQVTAYSGIMTYLANISPVVRDQQQSERISLLIAF